MTWDDAQFVFRIGLVSRLRGMPDFTVDLVLDDGVEPRHILLEASLLQDKRNRELEQQRSTVERERGDPGGTAARRGRGTAPAAPPAGAAARARPVPRSRSDASQSIRWFDPATVAGPDAAESEKLRTTVSFLSLTEELFAAQGRGEMGLLLLRYASELYTDGGLVLRDKDAFRLLGQFGNGIGCGTPRDPTPKTSLDRRGEPALRPDRPGRPGLHRVRRADRSRGGSSPRRRMVPAPSPILAVPLLVLGNVSLILVCQTPLEKRHRGPSAPRPGAPGLGNTREPHPPRSRAEDAGLAWRVRRPDGASPERTVGPLSPPARTGNRRRSSPRPTASSFLPASWPKSRRWPHPAGSPGASPTP